MNKLPNEKRAQLFACIAEGNSLRATSRLCDVAFNTVLKFFGDIGRACEAYQDQTFRGLTCKRVQLDELHSFVGARDKNATVEHKAKGLGDTWVWLGMDADTKLVPCWHVGKREFSDATEFVNDLASRLAHRAQISTDGHHAYLSAVENAFGDEVDYGMVVKIFSKQSENAQGRYAPPKVVGTKRTRITGSPDKAHISTSYIERLNLTLRMGNRRFTRLTSGYSKKMENHRLSLAISFFHYNFCRIHHTLRVTPAMEAGIANHVWELEEVIALLGVNAVEKAA
jgi:IS1 family transposase